MDRVKSELSRYFNMTDLGPVTQILGIEVVRDRDRKSLTIKQSAYIGKVLDHFRMADCCPTLVPMDAAEQLTVSEAGTLH